MCIMGVCAAAHTASSCSLKYSQTNTLFLFVFIMWVCPPGGFFLPFMYYTWSSPRPQPHVLRSCLYPSPCICLLSSFSLLRRHLIAAILTCLGICLFGVAASLSQNFRNCSLKDFHGFLRKSLLKYSFAVSLEFHSNPNFISLISLL
jgi:hypothetical protein